MIIREVMSVGVETIKQEAPLIEVAKKMQKRDCGCVVVVKDDRLVGMITDRDITIRCLASGHDADGTTAENIMTKEILYCYESDNTDEVARNMAVNKVRRLPVLNKHKRLVGIVSLGDLASHSNHQLCGEVLGEICGSASQTYNKEGHTR